MSAILKTAAIAAFAAASVGTASAATLVFTGTGAGETVFADFDTVTPTPSGGTLNISPAGGIPNRAAPVGSGNFAFVEGGQTLSFTFGSASSVGVDVGSIDSYNSFSLSFTDGTTQDFNSPFNGFTPADSARFTFLADAGQRINGITFASAQNSLEIDNIGLSAVPEPATWGMLIMGFGAVGGAMRRRRTTAKVAFA